MAEELEAKVEEMEAKEVVPQVEEVVGMLMAAGVAVVVPWAMKTLGQNAAAKFPVLVKAESRRLAQKEPQEHYHAHY